MNHADFHDDCGHGQKFDTPWHLRVGTGFSQMAVLIGEREEPLNLVYATLHKYGTKVAFMPDVWSYLNPARRDLRTLCLGLGV